MPSPGEKVSPKVTDEEGIDKPIILDWLIISVFQNKKTKPPFGDFVFTLRNLTYKQDSFFYLFLFGGLHEVGKEGVLQFFEKLGCFAADGFAVYFTDRKAE